MLFSGINLKEELIRERSRQQRLVDDVHAILKAEAATEKGIVARLESKEAILQNDGFNFLPEDSGNIFTLEEIRKICIRYRLRFLESSFFKSEYPYEAVSTIKAFEKKSGFQLTSFHIMAPAKAFDLEDINKDPLLFASLGNNQFYLLHQWGTDLAWYRKFLYWPLQSLIHFFVTLLICSSLFAFLLPTSVFHLFSSEGEYYLRIWLSLHTFIGLSGLCVWMGLAFDKTVSAANWNSKYYNF